MANKDHLVECRNLDCGGEEPPQLPNLPFTGVYGAKAAGISFDF
ncbi:MAG: hypothetical protein ACYC93_11755 [Candidatus Acidiferrales bacterium]